ncbi:LpqN/LpqT family lipoprotein [Mycobacterium sp. SM1]|uniref:LpqN/LpqT family lipoprotein n=1 Tax=Mycobacterium sp. SM1 TaxID=2816243 RepID=UPI001BCCC853|nr:LpqN/LpqT family lipoprotein [Mycobacterium sp. SM1]MBS4728135.1 LpqN/LpqT family lipoprotein [Mycobacterium sp. SM1]
MVELARSWRVPAAVACAGGLTLGIAGIIAWTGTTASAEPVLPSPAIPAPVTVTPTVAVGPERVGTSRSGASPSVMPNPLYSPMPPTPPAPPGPAAVVAPPQTLVPADSGTIREYLQAKGVKLEPQNPQSLKALDITLPMPAGWAPVPDPNVPDAFTVIANRFSRSLYTSNAQVVVYKLVGDFDPRQAITHGYVDSRQLPAWKTTRASLADFGGFPSSIIEGTYRQNDLTLNTSRRHVIASSGPDRYLVSLTVSTDVAQAVAEAPATDAIVNGFRVTPSPTTAPPGPVPVPQPTPVTRSAP